MNRGGGVKKMREISKQEYILKIRENKWYEEMDTMVEEYPVTLFLNGQKIISLMCTPSHIKELAYGFFYIKGLIYSFNEVKSYCVENNNEGARIFMITDHSNDNQNGLNYFELSEETIKFRGQANQKKVKIGELGIGFKKVLDHYKMTEEELFEMMSAFSKKSDLFINTGGVHSIGLYKKGEPILFYDDVSRYNTYNKLFGGIIMEGINLEDKMLLTTGRIPQEVMSWLIDEGIQCVLSISTPTRGSVLLAREKGIVLMGFVRQNRLNFYSPIK
jgi:FdhD protein